MATTPPTPKSSIIETFPLSSQWPTLDPFLFCAHHLDAYPAADGSLAPDVSLEGRSIGADFDGVDGWNMYHGSTVPGFPQHPHRGFETVTYVRRGWCDHTDSLGARARFGEGDVQWVTAGAGIVHSEMFPLFNTDAPNPLHLFQIWLNLPSQSKMVDPYFSMLWGSTLPMMEPSSGVEITVIAGSVAGATAPAAPPDSWAADPTHDVGIWHVRLAPGTEWVVPATLESTGRVLYFFLGDGASIEGEQLAENTGVRVDASHEVTVAAGEESVEFMVLQGQPIGEPVAQHGPFVMNTPEEIQQAMIDFRATGFGGWPWPDDDPVHGGEPKRFAAMPDGSVQEPA